MTFLQDVRYAARSLRKSPGFTTVAALTLALGVGANAAIFSIVNTVMLRPLPFAEPDRLVRIWESNVERGWPTFATSHPNFLDWQAQTRSFEGLAAWINSGFTWGGSGDAEIVLGQSVSASFLPTLRITPVLGRNFLPDEDRPGGNTRVVIISDGFWKRAFGGDPSVIGRTVSVNAQPHTIIGVLPASFRWGDSADMLAPLAPNPKRNRGDHRLNVIGRLAESASIEQATSELEALASQLALQYPDSNKGWSVRVNSFYDWLVPERTRQSLLVLLGAVGLVLLIACGNVANLLLARGAARQRELSIRIAMGATRGRIVTQLLWEASFIALLAAVLGTLIAAGAIQILVALAPDSVPRLDELSIDGRMIIFAVLTAMATTAVFGLMPAVQAARHDPQDALRVEGRGTVSGASRARIRAVVTVAEVALSVALLIGAGLLIRSFSRLQQVQPGFTAANLMTARVTLPTPSYPDGARRRAFYERFLTDLRGRPGVEAAAISSGPPLSGDFTGGEVRLPSQSSEEALSAAWRLAGTDYFATLGIPLRGREFTMQDTQSSTPVAIISQALADRFFPNEDPLGKTLILDSFGQEPFTIVGVAGDVRTFGVEQDAGLVYYGSATQIPQWNPMSLVWRSPLPTIDAVRASLRAIDPSVPLSAVISMDELMDRSVGPRRFNLYLLGAFAGIALTMAAIGLFGVMAYLVSQRTREIGVRLALGATRGEVFRLVLGRGLLLAGAGAVGGLGAALWLTRLMESLLFSVTRTDPVTFIAVPVTLLAIAALACYLPARRAMRIDPAIALRAD